MGFGRVDVAEGGPDSLVTWMGLEMKQRLPQRICQERGRWDWRKRQVVEDGGHLNHMASLDCSL